MGYSLSNYKDDARLAKWLEANAKRWQKGGKDRYYFSRSTVQELIKLDFAYYNSGNICWASIGGSEISNTKGRAYLCALNEGKYYLDLETYCIEYRCDYPPKVKDCADDIAWRLQEAIITEITQDTAEVTQ